MAVPVPVKLSAVSEPRIVSERIARKYATVTMNKIVINIKSTDFIQYHITCTETNKFDGTQTESNHECDDQNYEIPLDKNQYGNTFRFHIIAKERTKSDLTIVTENFQFSISAELTRDEMGRFLENILERVNEQKMKPSVLYRNFTKADETRINNENGGFFEMFAKGNSGHRSSPLYKNLDGVTYFMARLIEWNNANAVEYIPAGFKLPDWSYFGSERATYEPSDIINQGSVLFLGGMHCYNSFGSRGTWIHYITAVICQRDSLSFKTCEELGLLELDWKTNSILQFDEITGKMKSATELKDPSHSVWVEVILCDHAVPLSESRRSTCEDKGETKSPSNHKSSPDCKSCHGYLDKKTEGVE